MSFRTVLHRQHGLGYNYIDVVPPHYCRFKCVLSLIFIQIPSSTNYVSWIIFHFHFLFCFMGLIRNSLIIFLGIFTKKILQQWLIRRIILQSLLMQRQKVGYIVLFEAIRIEWSLMTLTLRRAYITPFCILVLVLFIFEIILALVLDI